MPSLRTLAKEQAMSCPHNKELCPICDDIVSAVNDMSRTRLDLTPPRFDVSGNKITGEFDEIKTPELIEVRLEDIEEVDAGFMPYFLMGVAVGVIAFFLAFVLLTIKGA